MSFWQVFASTLAAFLGIQKDSTRKRDFSNTSPLPFILMGILLAAAMVAIIIAIVNWVLS